MTSDEPQDKFAQKKRELLKKVYDLPHKPGVYLMRDRFKKVIYVGKARDLRRRVSHYFMPSRKMTGDLKTRALIQSIWDFDFHVVQTEPEALLLEGRLIKDFRPKYNVSFRDDKRFLLVKVDEKESWPRFRLARLRKDDQARYFGPFPHAGALRQTLSFMRKKFGVLTFGRGAPSERELKSSTYQVPTRLSEINEEEYHRRIARGCEFLSGQSPELLKELEEEMHKAAAALQFEKAVELRNMIEALRATTKPMRRFTRRQKLMRNIDPEADMLALKDALQLDTAPLWMECFDISNISSTHIVASMVCFKNGVPDNNSYRRYRMRGVTTQDDFASMAEVVRRRYSRALREARDMVGDDAEFSQESPQEILKRANLKRFPDLIIVDGGKGQLSAACKELQRLHLQDLPIIGLAKEFEEIYRPGRPLPLQLPEDSGALQLLQRIRDEAHRFANGYHQVLMKKRIAESILDDCPGISENRKQNLLRTFGSVERIRKASVEDIAKTEGISSKLAEQLKIFLEERT